MRHLVAAIVGLGVLIAGFAGLALAIVLGLVATGTLLVARLTSGLRLAMARRPAAKPGERTDPNYRVWNDGRGTIIDM